MEENRMEDQRAPGKTTIAPEVLLTIAKLTSLEVKGVSRMGYAGSSANRLFNRSVGEGVRIDIQDDTVSADIYIIMENGYNIRDVSRQVQQNVARAISKMVGMSIGRINVHIEDVNYPSETETEPQPEA